MTGSKKSLPTDWLCCLLSMLYQTPAGNSRIFDAIIVVTKTTVLSKQIKNSIKKMKLVNGVVYPDQGTPQQLKTFLYREKLIIVTTVRKFPVISELIAQMKNRRFAVIIHEAHSSQGEDTTRHLKDSLLKPILDECQKSENNSDLTTVDKLNMEANNLRGEHTHICYFGFRGSPGNTTLELFEARNAHETSESYGFISFKQKYMKEIYVGCSANFLYL